MSDFSGWDWFWTCLFLGFLASTIGSFVIDVIEAIGRARCHECNHGRAATSDQPKNAPSPAGTIWREGGPASCDHGAST